MAITREIIGSKIWANNAADPANRTEPTLAEIVAGWPEGKPPRQTFNWLDYVQHNNLAFFEQEGFYEWDPLIEYQKFGVCRAADDVLYISKVDVNQGNDPSGGTDLVNWEDFSSWIGRQSSVSKYVNVIESGSPEATAGVVVLPPGIYDVYAIGAGGGGGGGSSTLTIDGSGGGGGACGFKRYKIDNETTFSISIGVGGGGGAGGSGPGGDGGTTTFDAIYGGGGGGASSISGDLYGRGGSGGAIADSAGDIVWQGEESTPPYKANATETNSTSASYGGGSGGPMGSQNSGRTSSIFGAGGRGGNSGGAGAAGGSGIIVILGV